MNNQFTKLPKHVALILDGNGRWATQRNLPRTKGHEEGIKTLGEIVKESNKALSLRSLKLELFQRVKKKKNTGNHTHYIRNRSHYKYILIFPMYDFSTQPSET